MLLINIKSKITRLNTPWQQNSTVTFKDEFVYMAHYFILLRLSFFGQRADREGWWFEHSMSKLRACLSAEGDKHVSWP